VNRLDLCPLQESYSVQFGCSVQRDELPGGFSRYTTITPSKRHVVKIAYNLKEPDFLYFRAFYLNWQLNPLPFLMKLIVEDSEFKDYICQFVPESFSFNELNGLNFNMSAELIVVISPVVALTSVMYPYQFVESVSTDQLQENIRMLDALELYEGCASSIRIDNATLSDLVNVANTETESTSINMSIGNAEIRDALNIINAEIDAVRPSLNLGDAVLAAVVITTQMEIHNISSSLAMGDASLES